MPRPLKPVAGLALVFALAACSPGADVSPTPSFVTPSVTASASPTPTPDMDALYAEAERVLRRSFELEDRYMQTGNFDEYPPELYGVLADPYRSLSIASFAFHKENGFRSSPGTTAVVTVRPAQGVSKSGSEVALAVCLDTRPSPLVDANGNLVSPGGVLSVNYFFKRLDGVLKLFLAEGEEVESCPLG